MMGGTEDVFIWLLFSNFISEKQEVVMAGGAEDLLYFFRIFVITRTNLLHTHCTKQLCQCIAMAQCAIYSFIRSTI